MAEAVGISTAAPQQRVAAACENMRGAGGPVALAELADQAGVAPRQLQRDFADVLGTSPRRYGQAVRAERAREALRGGDDGVLAAAHRTGYGSVRSFYEEAARRLGMTPSEYAAGAPRHVLLWSVIDTSVGHVGAVATPKGLARVRIGHPDDIEEGLVAEFAAAELRRDDAAMVDVMAALEALAEGCQAPDLPSDVRATAFQARVWQALREIPRGETRSYAEVAARIGAGSAVRAVAGACAANPLALAVPCHRVIRSDGSLGGYRWGLVVKRDLLAREGALRG